MERDEKLKALDAALGQIEKQFGKGAVMKLGDPAAQMNIRGRRRLSGIYGDCETMP